MRYAVIGSAGQLGRDLCPRLAGEVIGLTRERADLARPDTLRAALTELRPDVVVNCAAYNFVDRAETEPDAAFAVNAWGVRHLALVCRDLDCALAHFSSDYVFGLDEARHVMARVRPHHLRAGRRPGRPDADPEPRTGGPGAAAGVQCAGDGGV